MSPRSEAVDHLVIGGGPAGSMVGLRLAAAGRQVTLVEKEHAAHHKVCGEFLSHEAVEYLLKAGVSARDLGCASIRNVRLSAGRMVAAVQLPFQALSLSRRVLDEALLRRAVDKGCEVIRGTSVVCLKAGDGTWTATLDDGRSLRAQTVFLATGKHDLHGWNRGKGVHSDLIGFKLHWRLATARTEELREWMDLFLFRGGYGGLSLVETDIANLCLVVRRQQLRRMGPWQNLLAAAMRQNRRLRHLLEGAQPLWDRPLAVSPIPYGYFAVSSRGLWRVGDQAAVVPSFTGDGMSIAMHSAHLAAQMFLAGRSTEAYSRVLRAQLGRRISLATWISRAIVTDAGRSAGILGASLFPGTMRWIAASTRVPATALLLNPAH